MHEEQEFQRQIVLLRDQIEGGGVRASMWRGSTSGSVCACYKESTRSSDRKCQTCHGVIGGYVPGYTKFGYNTLWMSSVDSDITLINTEVTTDFKSAKIQLSDGELIGFVESADKAFVRSAVGASWEAQAVSFVRIETESSVTVEYSLDSGATWSDISNLVLANPSSGTIRFRATLLRTTTSVLSPLFEIVRARYATIDLSDQRPDGTYTKGPWVRIMNSKPNRKYLKGDHGDFPANDGVSWWTTGLSYFDPTIEIGSRSELIEGPNVIFELLDGALQGKRYVLIGWQNSDPAATIVVSQTFQMRLEDPVGPYYLLW